MAPVGSPAWVFGFGSIVWKPGFPHEGAVIGFIKDYKRVFYQGSTDHRGTPELPGRVVTIQPSEGSTVWGAAYKLPTEPSAYRDTMAALEYREKQYDQRILVDVFTPGGGEQPAVSQALCFLASADKSRNRNYAGPASLEEIADRVVIATGPSGPNWEYVTELAAHMREIGADEPELYLLENMVLERMRGLGAV